MTFTPGMSIGEAFGRPGNNFDLMRLAGAWLVLFSHCFALTGAAADEPVAWLLSGAADGGRLGVDMFFVVSGFLVSRSVLVHPPAAYLRARLLRLWPALAVLLLVQTLLLGPACTVLPAWTYLTDLATWAALGRGLLFSPRLGLPGVFVANPLPEAVNGSLWTLRVELACYLLLLAAARAGLLRGRRVLVAAVAALALVAALQAGQPRLALLPAWLWDARLDAALDCAAHFVMGAAMWVHRQTIPRSATLAGLATLALLALAHTGLAYTWLAAAAFHVAFPYLVICAGLGPRVGSGLMRRLGDVSYGTYLYAFPVQQAIVGWSSNLISPWALAASASLPVFLLAVLSQRLVERPALRLKRRLAGPAGAPPDLLAPAQRPDGAAG